MTKPRILAVDDEITTFRTSLEPALPAYKLVCVETGREAVKVMEKESESISCILLDIRMPTDFSGDSG